MENQLKKMMKKIETALAAASFAEAGESDTARTLLSESRRVLLAIKQGKVDARTVKYALNTSKRIGADLDILYLFPVGEENRADESLENLESELLSEGVRYRIIRKTGCLKRAVIDYTNREKDILFAVVESPNSVDEDCDKKDTRLSELWQKLKCPLVVVMDEARA